MQADEQQIISSSPAMQKLIALFGALTSEDQTTLGASALTLIAAGCALARHADAKRRKLIFIAAYDELMSINEVLH
jgi:hypothetical protein